MNQHHNMLLLKFTKCYHLSPERPCTMLASNQQNVHDKKNVQKVSDINEIELVAVETQVSITARH